MNTVRTTLLSIRRFQPRAHLTTAALTSFIASFVAARTFTTFFPSTVFISGGIHFHHFWYGMAFLAIGGWLGINYKDKEIDLLAAILYGTGGGLIVDEAGLLLTFGNYWTGLTFSFFVVLLIIIFILLILKTYRGTILKELAQFERRTISAYLGVLFFAISIAFITETSDKLVIITSVVLSVAALIIVFTFLILRLKKKRKQT